MIFFLLFFINNNMALSEEKGECDMYLENQRKISFFITRLLSGVGMIPFFLLFIVYFKRRKRFTVMMSLHLQLAIGQFLGNASNAAPMIDTLLEKSPYVTLKQLSQQLHLLVEIVLSL